MFPEISETPFSSFWYFANGSIIFFLFFTLFLAKRIKKEKQENFKFFIISLLFLFKILAYITILRRDHIDLEFIIPLHMCDITFMASIFFLLTRNQVAFEIACFWGIPGSFIAFWTPNLVKGGSDFFIILNYYTGHIVSFFAVFWGFLIFKMRPREKIAVKIFFFSQLLIPIVGTFNYFMGTNFMYINKTPEVDNPFITGDFPYSLIGLELGTIFFMSLMTLIFYLERKLNKNFILKEKGEKVFS